MIWKTPASSQLQSQVNLQVALSELQRLEGTSLPRYKIQVEEFADTRPARRPDSADQKSDATSACSTRTVR